MPIRRWHGWQAVCPDCGEPFDLGDGFIAWAKRELVVEAVMDGAYPGDSQDEAIRDVCQRQGGCRGKKAE